ncbi:MAG: LPS export ABC transporter permease LptG [Bdellovibrionales bacterium]|nr:LPS export ABC transporter permease LptG [Bdellovibrionales bacterium]
MRPRIIHRYLLGQFLITLVLCLFAATSLFLIFDFFERSNEFFKRDATVFEALSYSLYKIPFIIHTMTPVAVLVSTLISVGRLSQNSEITAMRACGISLFWLCRPLIAAGLLISGLMFLAGETVVPWATQRSEEIYIIDIKKKLEEGAFSRANFWFRAGNRFFDVGLYDSRAEKLYALTIYEFNENFVLNRRIDANEVDWKGEEIGWTMKSVVEVAFDAAGSMSLAKYATLPLVIKEHPEDFYKLERKPETLNFGGLKQYIERLRGEGVVVTKYLVDLEAKIAFPFVNVIVVLIALPFALIPARSGSLSRSFVAGVTIGFGYYFVHAFCMSLGSAELIPVIPSAWSANILLGCLGAYLMLGAERA